MKAYYHLPGLFEFYDFYKEFLSLWQNHREFFYDWCEIGSIYGAPADALWGGGRVGFGDENALKVAALLREHQISARLTFSNSKLRKEHLDDYVCNKLCEIFEENGHQPKDPNVQKVQDSHGITNVRKVQNSREAENFQNVQNPRETENVQNIQNSREAVGVQNGVILHSDLLLDYLKEKYPSLYFVSSTTKVLTDFKDLEAEVKREDFKFVVPDFRLNKSFDKLGKLEQKYKDKLEFLCNECCYFGCTDRKACYENVSLKALGETEEDHICKAPNSKTGYRFSDAMKNPGFISLDDIQKIYMPAGFSQFKIEGRSLGSAIVLEFLLYYMVKPEYQLRVREEMYLDSSLDLF
ncbi:hypothetical protein [Lachnospira pectinoschiza]